MNFGVAVTAAILCAACNPGGDRCGPTTGTVTEVLDGDTIRLESGETIRYLLLDTPEVGNNAECYGDEARTFNTDLVLGKTVQIRYGTECEDRFDRLLAYIEVDGREVNQLLVERGFACVLFIPPNGADREAEFSALEERAELEGRGLWGACQETPC